MALYQDPVNGETIVTKDITPLPSAVRTATVNGPDVFLGDKPCVRLTAATTARSGTTPTLDLKVQTAPDNGGVAGTYRDLPANGSFAQQTAVVSETKSFSGMDVWMRIVATIGGTTPSFTSSVTGDAV